MVIMRAAAHKGVALTTLLTGMLGVGGCKWGPADHQRPAGQYDQLLPAGGGPGCPHQHPPGTTLLLDTTACHAQGRHQLRKVSLQHKGCLHQGSQRSATPETPVATPLRGIDTMKTCIADVQGHDEIVWAVEVSGARLFSASADKTIRVWDIESRRCEQVQPVAGTRPRW